MDRETPVLLLGPKVDNADWLNGRSVLIVRDWWRVVKGSDGMERLPLTVNTLK